MGPTAVVTARVRPKRKRAEISYKESSSDESEGTGEYGVSDKVLKTRLRKKLIASQTAVSIKPLSKRKIFPFMSLPAELKNEIYALALTDPNPIFLVARTKRYRRTVRRSIPDATKPGGYHRRGRAFRYHRHLSQSPNTSTVTVTTLPDLTPNVLLLNRAIYAETQPILYAGNTFAFEDTTALHAFLGNIGSKNSATITDVTLRGWGFSRAHKALNHPAFTMLAGAVNLSRLHVDCVFGWGGPKRVATQFYRDAFPWLEATGAVKGKYAAIDLIEISDENLAAYRYRRESEDAPSPEESMEAFRAELRNLLH